MGREGRESQVDQVGRVSLLGPVRSWGRVGVMGAGAQPWQRWRARRVDVLQQQQQPTQRKHPTQPKRGAPITKGINRSGRPQCRPTAMAPLDADVAMFAEEVACATVFCLFAALST